MSCADTDGVVKQARTTDASVRVMHLRSNIHSRLAWISTLLSGHPANEESLCGPRMGAFADSGSCALHCFFTVYTLSIPVLQGSN